MDDITTEPARSRYEHFSHEVAAQVTLRPAARALTAPDGAPFTDGAAVAVTTACTALATRIGLLTFVGAPADEVRAGIVPAVRGFEIGDVPYRLHGLGGAPSRPRLDLAGDRCVEAWRRWSLDRDAADDVVGVAGALSLAAWCSWAVGSAARARTRASYALDVVVDDPLARLVERLCRTKIGPEWWCGVPASGRKGPTVE